MGSPCLFTSQQAFKMGYFYWLCALKILIIFIQYLVSVTWETQSFILKAKLHLLT